jgi:predicted cytidylate kinase
MHISITGDLGSGKSTVAKEICRILNFKYLSTGLIQRQLGQERGMNTLEFNKFTDNNKEIDDYIDQKLKDVNFQSEPHVLDSRLGWHFVNASFKIYLMAIEEVTASRVLVDQKRIGEPHAADIKAKIKEQQERRIIENNRFEKNYGVKASIFKDFDIIIDTSSGTIEEVTNLILESFKKFQNNEPYNKICLSPNRIYPTNTLQTLDCEVFEDIKSNNYNANFPVECVLYKKEFYVFDGHKRLSAALRNKLHFIPIALVAKNENSTIPTFNAEKFVADSFKMDLVTDWEKAHDFKFFHYPAN